MISLVAICTLRVTDFVLLLVIHSITDTFIAQQRFVPSIWRQCMLHLQHTAHDGLANLKFWFGWWSIERNFIQSEKMSSICFYFIYFGSRLYFSSDWLSLRSVGRSLNQKFRFVEPSGAVCMHKIRLTSELIRNGSYIFHARISTHCKIVSLTSNLID